MCLDFFQVRCRFYMGGFNPFENYSSKWESSPNRGDNEKIYENTLCHSLLNLRRHGGGPLDSLHNCFIRKNTLHNSSVKLTNDGPLKTNMTMEHPHFQYEIYLQMVKCSIVMLVGGGSTSFSKIRFGLCIQKVLDSKPKKSTRTYTHTPNDQTSLHIL